MLQLIQFNMAGNVSERLRRQIRMHLSRECSNLSVGLCPHRFESCRCRIVTNSRFNFYRHFCLIFDGERNQAWYRAVK